MKKIGLLLIIGLFSLQASSQYHEQAGAYPKWYLQIIPGGVDPFENLPIPFEESIPVKNIYLSTGVKLEYVEQGSKDGIPVILLPGFPDSWRSYEQVMSHLPKTYHVFAITQRGHGNSDHPETGYFPKDFAADLAAFIKAFALKPAIIVGHSLGATITQQFVVKYPELVRGIVLEGAIASFADKKDMINYKQLVDQLQDPMDTAVACEFQKSTLAKPISEDFFNILLEESMKVKANVWKRVWEGLMSANFRKQLKAVKKPALIIWGEKDNFGPLTDQQFFEAAIKGASLIIYKETGHGLHWEEPLRFAKDVASFIDSIK